MGSVGLACRLLADLAGRAGKSADLARGERPFDVESCLRMRGAAGDQAPTLREHARRHPDLVRGGSTWGWVRAAASAMQQLRRLPLDRVRGEVTVVSCHDDTTVSLAAHREVSRRFARGRVVDVPAGHDPFVADRDARRLLWREIDRAVAREAA